MSTNSFLVTCTNSVNLANMSLGKRIKELRERRGMPQQHLAEMLGVARASVYKWENGQSPTEDHVLEMAKIFHVAPEYLRYGIISDAEKSSAATDERILVHALATALRIVLPRHDCSALTQSDGDFDELAEQVRDAYYALLDFSNKATGASILQRKKS